MEYVTNTPVPMTGEQVAGEAAKTRKQLEKIISSMNKSNFDIAELLHSIKKNGYYSGFNTFKEYTKTLELKPSRALYLVKMVEVMTAVGIPREQYEPLGISKLRAITRLEPEGEWTNPEDGSKVPLVDFIKGFIEKGQNMGLEEIHQHVNVLQGKVGENAMEWLHLYMKQLVIEQVAHPALEKAKMLIGSVKKDDEGVSQDASDGQAAEVVFVSFLNEEVQ